MEDFKHRSPENPDIATDCEPYEKIVNSLNQGANEIVQ